MLLTNPVPVIPCGSTLDARPWLHPRPNRGFPGDIDQHRARDCPNIEQCILPTQIQQIQARAMPGTATAQDLGNSGQRPTRSTARLPR
jgi:hypothetical protein